MSIPNEALWNEMQDRAHERYVAGLGTQRPVVYADNIYSARRVEERLVELAGTGVLISVREAGESTLHPEGHWLPEVGEYRDLMWQLQELLAEAVIAGVPVSQWAKDTGNDAQWARSALTKNADIAVQAQSEIRRTRPPQPPRETPPKDGIRLGRLVSREDYESADFRRERAVMQIMADAAERDAAANTGARGEDSNADLSPGH